MITKLPPFTYLTKTLKSPLRKKLASVCRAIRSISSEIKQCNLGESNALVFPFWFTFLLGTLKNVVLSPCNRTGRLWHCFRLRQKLLSGFCPVLFLFPIPATGKRFVRNEGTIPIWSFFKSIKMTTDKTPHSKGSLQEEPRNDSIIQQFLQTT